jgi:Tfp pilus assembly protein PilF
MRRTLLSYCGCLRRGLFLAAAALLAGCATMPNPAPVETRNAAVPAARAASPGKGEADLTSGIAAYEDGAYMQAMLHLQNALLLGLEPGAKQAQAHKYLAFIYCVGKFPALCGDEFTKALAADPGFDLTPAEAGHPLWGPVFRKQKAAARPDKNSR